MQYKILMEADKVRDTAIEMAKRMLVDSIWKSANLEGLGTTFPKTEAILANAPTTTKTEEVLFEANICGSRSNSLMANIALA